MNSGKDRAKDHQQKSPPSQPLYQLSTQFRNWRFSQSGLEQARRELNEGAVGRVKSKLEEERNVEAGGTDVGGVKEPIQIEYLTVEDELELVTFYLTKISQLCRASIFKFPETVEATAITYLKRFYLRNTCMDYHPKNIMLTCLFLATKTENTTISIDSFASRIPKTTNEDVLALEFLVAQSLKFQFKVHHAHLAARGIYLDLQVVSQQPINSTLIDRLIQDWTQVSSLLRTSRMTDLEFLWTPSQIAAAAWWTINRSITEYWLKEKFNRISNRQDQQNGYHAKEKLKDSTVVPILELDYLIKDLESISQVLVQAQNKPINKDRVTAVDRRLRFCRNPEKDPNSTLYKIKQAELENANLIKHQEKYSNESNQDPFI